MDETLGQNRRYWNQAAEAHLTPGFYGVESFREFPWTCFEHHPWLERREDGLWHIPDGLPSLPLSFAIRAIREQT